MCFLWRHYSWRHQYTMLLDTRETWRSRFCRKNNVSIVCLFVLRFYGPVKPMGSCRARSVSLPSHTFTGQALSSKRLTSILQILSPGSIYSKVESYRKENARETHVALQEVCGNGALFFFYSQVVRWSNQFNSGRARVKDSAGRGQKISASGVYFEEKVREFLESDRRYVYMWGTSPGIGLKSWYCSLSYSKLSSNAKNVSTLGTTPFDFRQSATSFSCHHYITKTRLFKYLENFTSKDWKFSDAKSLINLLFLLKTYIVGNR